MAPTLIILADGPGADLSAHLGPTAADVYVRLLSDTVELTRGLSAQIVVRSSSAPPASGLALIDRGRTLETITDTEAPSVASALAICLARGGPALVIGGNLPHLPLWRLRDALTHLDQGADIVIGPTDRGSWYLLGLRAAAPELLAAIPSQGESPDLLAAAGAAGWRVRLLPPWFSVETVADLAWLSEALRTMPPQVAPSTRAMIEASPASRAVGG